MSFNNWTPDAGASREVKTRTNDAKFGDGYEQSSADGLNSTYEVWNLAYTLRSKTEIQALDAYLKAQKGVSSFPWTTPNGDTLRFKCKTWSTVYYHDDNASLTCQVEQRFDQ